MCVYIPQDLGKQSPQKEVFRSSILQSFARKCVEYISILPIQRRRMEEDNPQVFLTCLV